ncbi:DUF4382 domain-containing protein [Flavobacterium aestivum]|uniref:DUF4382 domain-containing protein n=1 Tax=Flavobacterium aestivum TaxID=3003257 RepID=UPI00228666EA|nr:DUF4382 domain-containing protein [Flavobacterium aestivum]
MKTIKIILTLIFLGFLTNSCNDDNDDSNNAMKATYPYTVSMTDAPGPYEAVLIDLKGVEITGNNGQTVALNVIPGIYDLLELSNGTTTLIATDTLESANVEQIRLILGPNNSVVVNNISYPLSTPSAEQSGLKLQVHQTLQSGIIYNVLLDFDANQSIVAQGNGGYKLKPVIRTIETAISGIIKGKISPMGTLAVVSATSDVAYSTNVNDSGDFQLLGLPPGTYTVTVTPASPLLPVTISGVVVTAGQTTDIGTITF